MTTQNPNNWPDLSSDGQLLIGDTSDRVKAATLTAGNAIAITNGPNTIEVAASADYAWEYITSAVASSDAIVEFVNIFDTDAAAYENYVLILDDVNSSEDRVYFLMQVGSGPGPTWQVGSNYHWGGRSRIDAGYDTDTGNSIVLNLDDDASDRMGNNAGEGAYSAWIWSHYTQFQTGDRMFRIEGRFVDENTDYMEPVGYGAWSSATSINSVRFFMSSGNVASGNFAVYRQRRS